MQHKFFTYIFLTYIVNGSGVNKDDIINDGMNYVITHYNAISTKSTQLLKPKCFITTKSPAYFFYKIIKKNWYFINEKKIPHFV